MIASASNRFAFGRQPSMIVKFFLVLGLMLLLFACAEGDIPAERDPSITESDGRIPAEMDDPPEPIPEDIQVPVFNRQQVPSSGRSRAAVAQVAPGLVYSAGQRGMGYGSPAFIRIFKQERELEVWLQAEEGYQLFRTYPIAAMSGSLGPKLREGDRQAPEGFYYVPPSRMNPNSRFHLSFNLGYPNTYDRHHGRTGSALMVHGGRASIGCFAMTDPKIEEIYALVDAALRNGQPFFRVHIFPFRMTTEKMNAYREDRWYPFWENLKQGYDFFESSKQVPNVRVSGGRYIFEQAADGG